MADLWPQTRHRCSIDATCLFCKVEFKVVSPTVPFSAARVLDPGTVARLGAAADGALRACSPGHLSEMCRLKSPSPACRRLVLGLVAALGLRCAAVM